MLQLGGEKMSKSIGNLVHGRRIDRATADGCVSASWFCNPITEPASNFTEEGLEAAQRGLDRIRAALNPAAVASEPVPLDPGIAEATRAEFEAAMDDDFDTPKAMATIFALARAINRRRVIQPRVTRLDSCP